MTLLITVFAAIISTVIWYKHAPKDEMKVSILCWLYWGASLMWFVDTVYEYIDIGYWYFYPEPEKILQDLYLGLSVVAFGMIIWLVILMVKDPKGVIKSVLFKRQK